MKKFAFLFCAVAAALFLAACESSPKGYSVVDGVIVFDAPARAEGQHSVLRLTTDPMPVVRVGFIGLGMRGPGAVERFTYLDGVEIKALCDLYPDRVEESQEDPLPTGISPQPRPTAARRAGKSFAGATTSTSSISAPRGSCMCRWRFTPWSTASTWPWRFPPPCRSKSAGSWSIPPKRPSATA